MSKLTPFLNGNDHIEKWDIDTCNTDKILTVSGETLTPGIVINTLSEFGYNSEEI